MEHITAQIDISSSASTVAPPTSVTPASEDSSARSKNKGRRWNAPKDTLDDDIREFVKAFVKVSLALSIYVMDFYV